MENPVHLARNAVVQNVNRKAQERNLKAELWAIEKAKVRAMLKGTLKGKIKLQKRLENVLQRGKKRILLLKVIYQNVKKTQYSTF